jgi:hypothetical protein
MNKTKDYKLNFESIIVLQNLCRPTGCNHIDTGTEESFRRAGLLAAIR